MMLKDVNSAMYAHYRGLTEASKALSVEENGIQDTYIKVKQTALTMIEDTTDHDLPSVN